VLAQRSQLDEAATQFSEALRLQPGFAQAALHLGVVRWQQKKTDEALPCCSVLCKSYLKCSAHYYLGRVLEDTAQPDQAIEEFEARQNYNRISPRPMNPAWSVAAALRDAQAAVTTFRQVVELQPNDPDAHKIWGWRCFRLAMHQFHSGLETGASSAAGKDSGYGTNLGPRTCRRVISTLRPHNFRPR